MPIIAYDIIVALLIVFCAYQGYKKGFFLTLCGLLATFVALFGAIFIANTLAAPVADVVTPLVSPVVEEIIQEQISDRMDSALDGISLDDLEGISLDDLEGISLDEIDGISLDSLDEELVAALQEELLNDELMEDFSDLFAENEMLSGVVDDLSFEMGATLSDTITNIVNALVLTIARILIFIISFILLLAIWGIASHSLNLAFKLPLLSTANGIAGLGLGLVKGVVLAFLFALVVRFMVLSQSELESTMLVAPLLDVGPIQLFQNFAAGLQG